METSLLFVIGARIVLRRLKVIPVARGQASVSKNTLVDLFRPNLGQGWCYASFYVRESERMIGRVELYGRHGRGNK
jgi:hypothetical protein